MTDISRNYAIGMAHRTRTNLQYIRKASESGDRDKVHAVTQVVLSLLGLVIFPWERDLIKDIGKVKLKNLYQQGWPEWTFHLENTHNLKSLIRHIRNAAAHGRIKFNSDSLVLSEVVLEMEDCKPNQTDPYWRARIGGEELYSFCLLFTEFIEDRIG